MSVLGTLQAARTRAEIAQKQLKLATKNNGTSPMAVRLEITADHVEGIVEDLNTVIEAVETFVNAPQKK